MKGQKKTLVTAKKETVSYEKKGVPAEQIADIKEVFDLFDSNKNGTIEVGELKKILDALGIEEDNKMLKKMLRDVDENQNGEIDFDEFVKMLTNDLSETETKASCQDSYDRFIVECDNGELDKDTVKNLCDKYGIDVSEEEIEQMIKTADSDENGTINFDEFYNIITYSK